MDADDTSMLYTSENIGELDAIVNGDLDCFHKRLQGNNLSINVVKTQTMFIDYQPNFQKVADKKVDPPSFSIGDFFIELVKDVKYLGVQIDSKLDWNQHIKFLCSNVSRAIGF